MLAAKAILTLVILNNPGGIVEKFAHAVRTEHHPVRIVGTCESACTMYLGARDVCVSPAAKFMFHQSWVMDKQGALHPSAEGTAIMESFWPVGVRASIAPFLPMEPTRLWLHGSDLIGMGVRKCD